MDITTKFTNLVPAVKIVFPDGSTMTVTLDDVSALDFSFNFEFHSAYDSEGNIVGWAANTYDPRYPMPGSAIGYLDNGGVPVYNGSGGPFTDAVPTACYDTTCEFEDGVYSCTINGTIPCLSP